jgi:N-acyl-D-amino-acid deacylase
MDAKGLVIAPGFFDMHNHSDSVILTDGDARSMIRMGVTSMILGEGSSAAPTARFPLFTDYWAALLKGGVSTNIGSYVSSSVVFYNRTWPEKSPATPGRS